MKIISFLQEGLGNSSYLAGIGDGKAILVDPDRSVDRYVNALREQALDLVGVFETHLHADFVSGVAEIAHRTGVPLFLSSDAGSKIRHQPVHPGQVITLAGCEVRVVGSPGHTPEHVSYTLHTPGAPPALFSGGSLIVGGAARTDLISPEMTAQLTRSQFRTLHAAFSDLPDETALLPTHGPGSFCSAGSSGQRTSTLGRERRENPVLSIQDESEFARVFPLSFPAAPQYFFRLRAVNQAGPRLRREIAAPPGLGPREFDHVRPSGFVVDARSKEAFAEGHIPGSLNNTLRDAYPVWLGWLVPADANLLFVGDGATNLDRLLDESLLVGYERFGGWLSGGMEAWGAAGLQVARIELADAASARKHLLAGALSVDVREPEEFRDGHIEGALHIPLGALPGRLHSVPRDRPLVVYCGHGERASTGASLLEAAGFRDLVNLDGGIGSWEDAGYGIVRGD